MVDDSDLVLRALCRPLRRYRPCLAARSLAEGYAYLDAGHRIIGAIVDVRFPEEKATGFELLEHMRQKRGYRGPALVVSGEVGPVEIARAYDLDAGALQVGDALSRIERFARECIIRTEVRSRAVVRAIETAIERYGLGECEIDVLVPALNGRTAEWFRIERNMPDATYRSRVKKLLRLAGADTLDDLVRESLLEAVEEGADALAV